MTNLRTRSSKVVRIDSPRGNEAWANLIDVYDGMAGWIDEGRCPPQVDVAYLSFSKAFYSVSHKILIGKLRKLWVKRNGQ